MEDEIVKVINTKEWAAAWFIFSLLPFVVGIFKGDFLVIGLSLFALLCHGHLFLHWRKENETSS